MNRRSIFLSSVVLLALMLVGTVPGFSSSPHTAKVVIPFDFTAGPAELTAGTYLVMPYGSQGVLSFTSDSGRRVLLMTHSGRTVRLSELDGKLVFQRNGAHNALAEICLPGMTTALELNAKPAEPVTVAFAQ